MDYLCSENKGADQLCGYHEADLRLCFSHMQNVGFLMTRLICWLLVVRARSQERDLIFPPQIEEEAACILVLSCPCVEHDQIFQIQFEEVGNAFDLDCPFIQSRVSILFCFSAEVQ